MFLVKIYVPFFREYTSGGTAGPYVCSVLADAVTPSSEVVVLICTPNNSGEQFSRLWTQRIQNQSRSILSFTIKVQCDGRAVANLPCPSGSRGLGRRGTFVPMTSQR